MSLHSQLVEGGSLKIVLDQHGQTVVYEQPGQSPVSLTASLSRERRERRRVDNGIDHVYTRRAVVTDDKTEATFKGLTEGNLTGVMVIGGKRYNVESVMTDEAVIRFELVRPAASEISRSQYRGQF